MKRLLVFIAALSIATGAMAQSKGAIKDMVNRLYDKVEMGVERHLPVTIDYARVISESYDVTENAESKAIFDKAMDKERKRFLKGATDQEREYFLAYEAIMNDCEGLDVRHYYTASLVYMDFVCQYLKIDRPYDAMFYMTDFMVFSASLHADVMYGVSYWKECNPTRYEYVNEQIEKSGLDIMMEDYVFHFFKESYAEMSEAELAATYISHVEAVVECYDRGDRMGAIRNAHAMQIIREYGDQEALLETHMEWAEDNYEMAVAYQDCINELFSHE